MNALGFPFYATNPFGLSSNGSNSVAGHVPSYTDTSGLVLQDSGFSMSDKLNIDGSNNMTGDLNINSHNLNNFTGLVPDVTDTRDVGTTLKRTRDIYMSGSLKSALASKSVDNIVANSSSSGANKLAKFVDTSGTNITDSGLNTDDVVISVSPSIADNVAIFTDTSGNEIKDSGINLSSKLNIDGSNSMTGDLNMNSHNVNNTLNVVPVSNATHDIGSSSLAYNNVYAFNIDSSGTLNIGSTIATSVTLGKATVPTILGGKGYLATTRPIMSGGYVQTTNVTVTNTTTETVFIGAGVGSLTSAANTLSVGNASRFFSSGTVGIAAGTQTITLRLYGGPTSTLLLATNVIPLQSLTPAASWRLDTMSTVKSIGVSGTVQLNANFIVNDVTPSQAYVNQTLATIDTTVTNVFKLTVQWTNANASNTITQSEFITHSIYVV